MKKLILSSLPSFAVTIMTLNSLGKIGKAIYPVNLMAIAVVVSVIGLLVWDYSERFSKKSDKHFYVGLYKSFRYLSYGLVITGLILYY